MPSCLARSPTPALSAAAPLQRREETAGCGHRGPAPGPAADVRCAGSSSCGGPAAGPARSQPAPRAPGPAGPAPQARAASLARAAGVLQPSVSAYPRASRGRLRERSWELGRLPVLDPDPWQVQLLLHVAPGGSGRASARSPSQGSGMPPPGSASAAAAPPKLQRSRWIAVPEQQPPLGTPGHSRGPTLSRSSEAAARTESAPSAPPPPPPRPSAPPCHWCRHQ
mmetsp:Transcript_47889/g.114118  ORF Transcript_47889/g.114118 Transcript_47889/m.114118 type:complete len:224 (+) Transcript_47889:910-1581(+)